MQIVFIGYRAAKFVAYHPERRKSLPHEGFWSTHRVGMSQDRAHFMTRSSWKKYGT